MIAEENYSELYRRFKDLQRALVNDTLAKIVAEYGKKDEEEDYCGLFLPVPGGLTLSYFLGESSGRSVLEVAYICLLNDEVSVTGRLKSERITFQDGMFDPNAFYTDGTFGSPAIIDQKDLCEIADALRSKYWGVQSGPSYNDYSDLHHDIYKSIAYYCKTSQDMYSHVHGQGVSLHMGGSVQVCVDKGVDLYLGTVEMNGENVVVTCDPESYGYNYFLVILTPDMKDPCIAKFYKKDGNGNTAHAIIKTTDLLRILRAAALYSRNGLWPGISPLNERDDAKDLLGDTSCEHNEELVKELSELISKNGSKESFLSGMTGVSIRHEGQIVGFEDSRIGRLPYSYSFSFIASDVDGAVCFFDDCDHLVLKCDGYSSCQNSSLDDHLTYEDHQYVTIPDWQLRELCDLVRRKFEAD